MITSDRIDGKELDFLKGAPEIVIGMCDMPPGERERLLALANGWAGLVAMEDPIREGVRESVAIAERIAQSLGLIGEGEDLPDGSELAELDDAPALKRANIGVVVGSATDVAEETADLILLDNNFRTVVAFLLFGHYHNEHGNIVHGRSFAFASFAINSMIYIFAYRSMRRSLFRSGRLSRNKPLVLAVLGGLALGLIAVVEIGKLASARIFGRRAGAACG